MYNVGGLNGFNLMFMFIANTNDIVQYDPKLDKDLARLPNHVLTKLRMWVEAVNHNGINEVRKIPGFYDEPLQGDRKGQRSIRLNKAYRAIYIEDKKVVRVTVIEVNKHEY
jgi:proteic killer suppression protein